MFRIGDVVIGKPKSSKRYSCTNEYSVCTVVDVSPKDEDDIRLRIDEHYAHDFVVGDMYWVSSRYFELFQSQIKLEAQSVDQFNEMIG